MRDFFACSVDMLLSGDYYARTLINEGNSMGYETKIYVVEPSALGYDDYAKYSGAWLSMFSDSNGNYVYPDGNTKTYLNGDEEIVKRKYSSVVAMIDMCKMGYDSKISTIEKQETDCMIYAEDGNSAIIEDRYEEKLKQLPIDTVIECLKKDYADEEYRRFKIALDLLTSISEQFGNVQVLFYGY